MKNISLILFISLCFVAQIISQENIFSLEQAIEFANEQSDLLKLDELELQDATASIKEFKSIGLPKLDANLNYQYNIVKQQQAVQDFITPSVYDVLFDENVIEERDLGPPASFELSFLTDHYVSGGLEASALIFDGSYLVGLQAAKMFENLKEKAIHVTEQNIKAEVTRAYLACLILDEIQVILEKNIETISKIENETRAVYNEGFAEQLDVDRLQLTLNNLVSQLVQLNLNKELSKNILKFQMNYPIGNDIILSDSLNYLFPVEILSALDISTPYDINDRAEIDELNTAQSLNELDLKRFQKSRLPSVRASAAYSASIQRNELFNGNESGILPASFIGLGVSVPIYDGSERSAQIQRRRLTIEKTDIQIDQFKKAVDLEVSNAKIAFLNANQKLNSVLKSLDLAESIHDKALIKFKEGVGSSIEVNQAEQSLFEQQTNYINALYDLVVAKVNMDIASGQL